MAEKKKAISYIRYSTLLQGERGKDSTRRQKQALQDALARWNLELDAQFTDAGKSGYHQKHLAKGGAMRQIRDMAVNGQLRGKALVFENWDRAGRLPVLDAAPLLTDILNNGCDIVCGEDGGKYLSRDIVNDHPELLTEALTEMDRGLRESKRKTKYATSKRQQRLDALKRGWKEAVKDEPMGLNNVPFWIINEWTITEGKPKCTGNFLIKPYPHYNGGLEKLIQDIFGWYIGGLGGKQIANKLNHELKLPLPSGIGGGLRSNANVWHDSKINFLIKHRGVMGYYQGTDYKVFPEIIDETTFARANTKRQERTIRSYAGRKIEHVNPYAGLCECAACHGSMTRKPSGRKMEYCYLQCRSSRGGRCSASGIPYPRFEESFSVFFSKLDTLGLNLNSKAEPSKADEIRNQIAFVETQIDNFKKALGAQADPSKAITLGTMVTEYDIQRAQLLKDLESEESLEAGRVKVDTGHFNYLKKLFSGDSWKTDKQIRLDIQEALRVAVDKITIDVKTQSYTVKWKNSTDVYKVQLTRNGYKVSGAGTINLTVQDFDKEYSPPKGTKWSEIAA